MPSSTPDGDPGLHIRRLLSLAARKGCDERALADLLGSAVDLASDIGDEEALQLASAAIQDALTRAMSDSWKALLHYFDANAWSSLRHLRHKDLMRAWDWESPEHEREILSLRRSVSHPGFADLDEAYQCRVLTNLANTMSNIGRVVEAIEYYDRVLDIDGSFGMALGNKGLCLLNYARIHHEPSHQCIFAGHAAEVLERALCCALEAPDARDGFVAHLEIAKNGHKNHDCADREHLHGHSLGDTDDERRFRSWALRNRLFLNPLNDLGPFAVAAWDYLHMPQMTVNAEIGTAFQLKQEYAAARWLVYESLERRDPTYVDCNLNLLDTMDQPSFGIGIEKVKLALRSSYSLFDKIAGFVCNYLGIEGERRYFRWFWYRDGKRDKGLRSAFSGRQSLPLRALFWLSKDLLDVRNDQQQEAMEPDARMIAALRNELEHGYVKVHRSEPLWLPDPQQVPPDPMAFRVSDDEIRGKAMRVLKLSRAALIYLSLASSSRRTRTARPFIGSSPPRVLIAGKGVAGWYGFNVVTGVRRLPKCRFSGRRWKSRQGVIASRSYCTRCRAERHAVAIERLRLRPLDPKEAVEGKYLRLRRHR